MDILVCDDLQFSGVRSARGKLCSSDISLLSINQLQHGNLGRGQIFIGLINYELPDSNVELVSCSHRFATDVKEGRSRDPEISQYPGSLSSEWFLIELNCEIVIFSCLEVTWRPSHCQVHDTHTWAAISALHASMIGVTSWSPCSRPHHSSQQRWIFLHIQAKKFHIPLKSFPFLLCLKSTYNDYIWIKNNIFTPDAMSI